MAQDSEVVSDVVLLKSRAEQEKTEQVAANASTAGYPIQVTKLLLVD